MPRKKTNTQSHSAIAELEHHLVPVQYRIPFYMGMFMGAIVAQVLMISFLTLASL